MSRNASIKYNIIKSGRVAIKLYNTTGRLAKILLNEYQNTGSYLLSIDNTLLQIPDGIYFLWYEDQTNQKEIKLIVE